MASNYRVQYNIDIVFCIDATASMSMQNVLETVKQNTLNFYDDLLKKMSDEKKYPGQVRVRFIVFRDYLADGKDAMLETDFFNLPQEAGKLAGALETVEALGGGDDPEDGLEALAYAIRSKWNTKGKKRHVIVVWSDEGTHPLGYGKKSRYYPADIMPVDMEELTEWWGTPPDKGYMDEKAKRLVIFAPDKSGWKEIGETWNQTIHFVIEDEEEWQKLNYYDILDVVAQSV